MREESRRRATGVRSIRASRTRLENLELGVDQLWFWPDDVFSWFMAEVVISVSCTAVLPRGMAFDFCGLTYTHNLV